MRLHAASRNSFWPSSRATETKDAYGVGIVSEGQMVCVLLLRSLPE